MDKKSFTINVRIDENMHKSLLEIAQRWGLSYSDLIRKVLLLFILNNIEG